IVAYCLEITDLDPIRYDLLFERFLNPGRKSMPDIDIDFAVDGRERVINYVAEKYGRDRVAQIITFSTMAARAAVRDAGRVLEVIDKACALIGGLDITAIPMDDRKTYEMLAKGEATGVFQFESSGMREALRQVKPTEFEDLIALVALYRPGPMQYIPNYAARKAGREVVTFIDPRLKPITGATYAIAIYQEQSMEIAKQIAGFTP